MHIGDDDGEALLIREKYPNKIIGVSCKSSIKKALAAQDSGASYVSFGALFPTQTKKDTKPCDIAIFYRWNEVSNMPATAIGGINHDNISEIIDKNIDFICVISAIWNYKDGPIEALHKLRKIIDSD